MENYEASIRFVRLRGGVYVCCILIVDDEMMIRKVIREYCEYEGYRVMEAGDGREAVQICRDHEIKTAGE